MTFAPTVRDVASCTAFLNCSAHGSRRLPGPGGCAETIWLSMGVLFAGGYILTLGLGLWLYLAGAVTLGTVYLFFNYMSMLETPLDQITQQLQEFQKAAAGIRRVSELLDTPSTVKSGAHILGRQAHSIQFEEVRFRYAEQEVLKGLTSTWNRKKRWVCSAAPAAGRPRSSGC
jgi:ABC-type multidrug transport system fused ATPase/permease subunit